MTLKRSEVSPGLIGVPALTLRNPWAHLIAHGEKRIENRTWAPPDYLWRLFIHAGKAWDPEESWYPLAGDVGGVTTSAIVAVADLAHVCLARGERCACGPWAVVGQVHWNLANVVTLAEPVPCKGRQGLWRLDDDLLALVDAQFQPSEVDR